MVVDTGVHIGILSVEGLLGFFLAYAVYLNFSNSPMLMKLYGHLRLARWYTLLAGVLLTIGAVALLIGLAIPVVGELALFWLVAYFVVATLTHVVRRDKLTNVAVPLVFLAVVVALATLRWAEVTPLLSSLYVA